MLKTRSFNLGYTVILMLFLTCNSNKQQPNSKPEADLYLPDMPALFEGFEVVDSLGNFQEFANNLFRENRDLNSSELYVYSAMFYARADMADSTLIALNKAIDFGMSNPKILDKYDWTNLVSKSSLFPEVSIRLDSIAKALKNVENFGLELGSMSAFWPYLKQAQADTTNATAIFKDFIFEGPQEVRDFYVLRYESTENMKRQMVTQAPKYYQYLSRQFSEDSINSMKSQIEAWMRGFKSIYPKLRELLSEEVEIKSKEEFNAALYKMLNTEFAATYTVFTLILIIALFNLTGALITIIIDKKEQLRSIAQMGLNISQLKTVFFVQGLFISVLGGGIGLLFGSLIIGSQIQFEWLKIAPSLPYPVSITVVNYLIVFVTISVLGSISSLVAAQKVSPKLLS